MLQYYVVVITGPKVDLSTKTILCNRILLRFRISSVCRPKAKRKPSKTKTNSHHTSPINHGEEEVEGAGREPQDEAVDGRRADSGGGSGAFTVVQDFWRVSAHLVCFSPPSSQAHPQCAVVPTYSPLNRHDSADASRYPLGRECKCPSFLTMPSWLSCLLTCKMTVNCYTTTCSLLFGSFIGTSAHTSHTCTFHLLLAQYPLTHFE